MSNAIETAALAIDDRAMDLGERLSIGQFIDIIRRRNPAFPGDDVRLTVLRLVDEGRLKTHTDRPRLRARGRGFGHFRIGTAQPCHR